MNAIIEQLELNQTFFYQIAIFAVLFFLLRRIYFVPFMKLFEARYKKTVEDREAAERLMKQAEGVFADYTRRMTEERAASKKEYEEILTQAHKNEAELLAHAREEAKKITREAVESVATQRAALRKQLEADIEGLARGLAETLLSKKARDPHT